jgi:excisionase family DNA binding protein
MGELTRCVAELVEALRGLTARAPLQAEKLLTPEEAAEVLQIPARTLRARAATQHFPHHRLGKHYRFSRDDMIEILRITQVATRPPVRRQFRT